MALDAILANKRSEVAIRRATTPLATVVEGLARSNRDFEGALRHARPAFILEVKPASPSEGPLRDVAELTPAIACYGRRADAVSVVTDGRYFGGSFELLARVRALVPQPILCKDFVLDPYQVYEARRAGADAVLLMLSVLDDAGYRACEAAAASVGMGILTEVHSATEMTRAKALGARVIGINNRDLRTLAVDLDTTPGLARSAPSTAIVIAESGIRARADVRRLAPAVDGFLIGTALMGAADVDRAARRLIYGETKVCGLTSAPDGAAAERAGATHGGVIFAPESPRWVTEGAAREIRDATGLDMVGVFVNASPRMVASTAATLRLAAVQLHGEEDASYLSALGPMLSTDCEIWKAIRVPHGTVPEPESWGTDRVLLDGFEPGRRGGTGRRFDWSVLRGLRSAERVILSGGLTAENLPEAAGLPVDAFDVNSGVETEPGRKSPDELARFFSARRAHPGRRAARP